MEVIILLDLSGPKTPKRRNVILYPRRRFVSLVLTGALALSLSTGALAAATPESALPQTEGILLEEESAPVTEPAATPQPAPVSESVEVPAVQPEAAAEQTPQPAPVTEEELTGVVGEEGSQSTFEAGTSGSSLLDPNSRMVPASITATFHYDEAHKVLTLVNQIRAQYGLNPLSWDSTLEQTAALRAAECTVSFSHTRPNGQDCFSAYPSGVRLGGENIAAGSRTAEQVVNLWMNSPGHRANILNPGYTTMAVSMAQVDGTTYGYYWSQNFTSGTGNGQYAYSGTTTSTVISEAAGTDAQLLVKNFVIRLYELVLERSPDVSGLANWYTAITTGKNSGAQAAQGFFFSDEFLNKKTSDTTFIQILYRTMLNREADQGGMNNWLNNLKTGFSRTYIFRGFAESNEFSQICSNAGIIRGSVALTEARDQNAGVTGFVSRLYSIALSRTPDVNGLNNWTSAILNGVNTPEQVGYGFFFSPEMEKKNLSDEEFVTLLYRVFLDRTPDKQGLADWVSRLKDGMKREALMYGISKSAEFNTILNSFGLAPTQGQMVYVVANDNSYHVGGCAGMGSKRSVPLLLQDAVNIGYTPCPICH